MASSGLDTDGAIRLNPSWGLGAEPGINVDSDYNPPTQGLKRPTRESTCYNLEVDLGFTSPFQICQMELIISTFLRGSLGGEREALPPDGSPSGGGTCAVTLFYRCEHRGRKRKPRSSGAGAESGSREPRREKVGTTRKSWDPGAPTSPRASRRLPSNRAGRGGRAAMEARDRTVSAAVQEHLRRLCLHEFPCGIGSWVRTPAGWPEGLRDLEAGGGGPRAGRGLKPESRAEQG